VAFCSVLNNKYNKILRNGYLLQLNVFKFLLRKNKQALIVNVAIYKSGLESGFFAKHLYV
jgi:hypothetical protein